MNSIPTCAELREKLSARGSMAFCPAHHNVNTPALSINEKDGKTLVNCHGGCTQDAVIEALQAKGIWPKPTGITVADLAAAKGLPEALLRDSGFADDEARGLPVIRMQYRDAHGREICTRYRGGGGSRFWFRRGHQQQLFGLWRLKPEPVIVVEGETDAMALWAEGFNAIGVPGAEAWKDDRFASSLAQCPILYVHVEPDPGGEKFKAAFERSQLRERVKFFTVASAAKDPCELRAKDLAGFATAIDTALAKATSADIPAEPAVACFESIAYAALTTVTHAVQLVKGLLVTGTLFVVYGESNSGKTFWVIDLLLAIAAGEPWRGRPTRQGLVLYIAGEGSASVKARGLGYRLRHPNIPTDIPFFIIPEAVNFLDTNSVAKLIATAHALERATGYKTAAVLSDTFARSMPGGDENSAKDVGEVVTGADYVRKELDCCVGFVHHAGKDATKGARGSSALRAACDTEIFIEGLKGSRTVTVTKQRDLDAGAPMAFELAPIQIGTDESGDAVTTCTVTHKDPDGAALYVNLILRGKAQQTLVAALRSRAEKDPEKIWSLPELRELGKDLGQSKSTTKSAVDRLVTTPYLQASVGGYRFVDGEPRR